MSSLKAFWSGLHPLIQVLLIVVGVWIIYKLIVRVSTSIKAGTALAATKGEIDALKASGETLSYPPSEYSSMADKVVSASKGLGTDEAALHAVFNRLNNNLDFLELKKVFGTREGSDLGKWVSGEGESESVNSILNSKGITYRL